MSCLICHSLLCVCGLEDVEPESPFDIVREARQPKLSELSPAELPVQGEAVGKWRSGNLLTMNQEDYPGLAAWYGQVWEGEEVVARVYGKDHEQVRERIAAIATPTLKPSVNELVEALVACRSRAKNAAQDYYDSAEGPNQIEVYEQIQAITSKALASHQSAKEQV
jgi:hypothetical protein